MRWILTTIIVIGCSFVGYTQQKYLKGQVNSGSQLRPINNVHVKMGRYSAKTDYDGRFSVRYTKNELLVLSHSNYNIQKIPFEAISNTQEHQFYLTPSSHINSMILESTGSQTVYEKEFENVFDYTFRNDTLIVVSYMITGRPNNPDIIPRENCTYTAMKYGRVIDRKVIPDYVERLFDHPDGRIFLEAIDTYYVLKRTPEKLSLEGFDFKSYKDFVSLTYGATQHAVFFALEYPFLPLLAHKMYSHKANETYVLALIENREYTGKVGDDFAMLTQSEIQAARELENTTGVNYRMFSPYLRSFYMNRDLTRPYAPGFVVDNEVIIFDHLNNRVFFYDLQGNYLRSNGVYHNNLLREKLVKMIQDPFTESLYTLHERNGLHYVRKVDIKTGASGKPFKLQHPFAEKVKVFENYVYYLHKSSGNNKVMHLVREELPYSSEQSSLDGQQDSRD